MYKLKAGVSLVLLVIDFVFFIKVLKDLASTLRAKSISGLFDKRKYKFYTISWRQNTKYSI